MHGKPAQAFGADAPGQGPAVDAPDTAPVLFEAGAVFDDEPTPFDPPSFDLGAVVRHAEELPERTTSSSGVVTQPGPRAAEARSERSPGSPAANDQPASMLVRAGDAQMPQDGEVIDSAGRWISPAR